MESIWLIPLLPGIGAAINGLVGIRFFGKRLAGVLASFMMGWALWLSLVAFWELLGTEERFHQVTVASWIPPIPLETVDGIGSFSVDWSFTLDPLSAMMLLIVTGIGFLIHIYSIGYIEHEPRGGVARFFCYLNLFCFFMLTLVLGSNFLVMFVGWEGVGLCSYLLIGYWYQKKSASDAGKKAFIVNRIGDWGFVLGVFLVFFTFGTLDFRAVAEAASHMPVETAAVGFGVISAICLFLFIGATGKSAQIPLYVWLPDAMEGPTPVSALIHAATMVTAGVYMVCRNAVLFTHAPMVMEVVAIVGVLTALVAATIGLVQTDIKRVLAYSTVSQLGYMFLATGVGAFGAAAFHLMTHAFFKALLFLGSGSVIHGMNEEQDMRRMGGLRQYMPVTALTMAIGAVAIAGIPPFSGFFSKDEILFRTYLHHGVFVPDKVLWGLGVVTAMLTAFYMFRLINMTFFGAYRGPAWGHGGGDHGHDEDGHGHAWHGPHESPRWMTIPLVVLAVGAMLAGFVGVPIAFRGRLALDGDDRALPASELRGGGRARRRGGPPHVAARRAGPDGVLGADRARRHLVRVPELRRATRRSRTHGRELRRPAPRADQQVLRRRAVRRDRRAGNDGQRRRLVGRRSPGRGRRRQRDRLDDHCGGLGVARPRQVRRGRPRQPDRLALRGSQLRFPPGADRPDSELRVRHAARRVRVRDLVPRRPVIGHCHE